MIVYWDMDGVLNDFVGDIARLSNFSPEDYDAVLTHESYLKQREEFGAVRLFAEGTPLDLKWNRSWMEFFVQLGHSNEILTSLELIGPMDHGAETHMGKAQFLTKHYGHLFYSGIIKRMNTVATGVHKALFATPDSILIDDHSKIVSAFKAAGGNAILYHHSRRRECLQQVCEILGIDT